MKTYKVYECEDKVSARGTTYKVLVLQGEGDQYPMKNVKMWNSHPLFEDIAVGQKVELDVESKDSTTPNPHGGFYKNRTVLNPGQAAKQNPPKNTDTPHEEVTNAKIFNLLNLKILPEIQALKDRLDVFIDEENIQPKFNRPKEITEEDSPF